MKVIRKVVGNQESYGQLDKEYDNFRILMVNDFDKQNIQWFFLGIFIVSWKEGKNERALMEGNLMGVLDFSGNLFWFFFNWF